MDKFEGVEINGNPTDLVVLQLKTGRYSKPQDELPGQWLKRAWEAISPAGKQQLTEAIHQALLNDSSQVRVEALVLLEVSPAMVNSTKLLEVAQNHLNLFEGLRHSYDPPHANRARDLVRMASASAQGSSAAAFRQKMAVHPEYGSAVLAGLAKHNPEWLLQNLTKVINPTLDPQWKRPDIVLYNLRGDLASLEKVVKTLATEYPESRPSLAKAITQNIKNSEWQKQLLNLVGH